MSNNDFEKNVKHELDELFFEPSDEVWDRVEAQLPSKRRRRWLLLFLPLSLAGLFLLIYNYLAPIRNRETLPSSKMVAVTPSYKSPVSDTSASRSSPIHQIKRAGKFITSSSSVEVSDEYQAPEVSRRGASRSGKQIPFQKPAFEVTTKTKTIVQDPVVNVITIHPSFRNEEIVHGVDIVSSIQTKVNGISSLIIDTIVAAKLNEERRNDIVSIYDRDTSAKEIGKEKPANVYKRWVFGITAGAGLSNTTNGLFDNDRIRTDVLTSGSTSGMPSSPASFAASSNKPTASLTFNAGLFLERTISDKLKLHTELSYVYHSNRMQVGAKVDSSANFVTNAGTTFAASYYRSGSTNNYKNSFHLITVPLTLLLKPMEKVPIFAEAGFSASLLASSKALQYNARSDTYFKSQKGLNRIMVGMQGGVGAEFKNLKLGYRYNYSFSSVFENDPQHLVRSTLYLQLPLKKF